MLILTMLRLNTLVQSQDGLVDGESEHCLRGLGVGLPSADLVEHEFDEERKAALGDGLIDYGPLRRSDGPIGFFQPCLDNGGAQFVAKWEHLHGYSKLRQLYEIMFHT